MAHCRSRSYVALAGRQQAAAAMLTIQAVMHALLVRPKPHMQVTSQCGG